MSRTYKEMEEELTYGEVSNKSNITPRERELYLKAYGSYDSDDEIARWLHKPKSTKVFDTIDVSKQINEIVNKTKQVSTGGKTDFYDCTKCEDVDDLAEHWDMRGDEFNCLKALVGIAKGARHDGTSPLRDANKLVHYANRILKRLTND